jgi:hypothetical protein
MLESVQVGLYHKLEQNQIAIDGTTKTVKTSLKDAENQLQSILNVPTVTAQTASSTS